MRNTTVAVTVLFFLLIAALALPASSSARAVHITKNNVSVKTATPNLRWRTKAGEHAFVVRLSRSSQTRPGTNMLRKAAYNYYHDSCDIVSCIPARMEADKEGEDEDFNFSEQPLSMKDWDVSNRALTPGTYYWQVGTVSYERIVNEDDPEYDEYDEYDWDDQWQATVEWSWPSRLVVKKHFDRKSLDIVLNDDDWFFRGNNIVFPATITGQSTATRVPYSLTFKVDGATIVQTKRAMTRDYSWSGDVSSRFNMVIPLAVINNGISSSKCTMHFSVGSKKTTGKVHKVSTSYPCSS